MIHRSYVDLSGFSFTGKSAYNNLFAEFEGFYAHDFDFEFDLVRTKDGISDLYAALIENWSPVRSSEAIRGFGSLIHAYQGRKSFFDRLLTLGRHYDERFPGFLEVSKEYIDELVDAEWRGQWPYAFERSGLPEIIIRKLLFNIGIKNVFEANVYLSSPSKDCFIDRTQCYLNDILSSNTPPDSIIVMSNVLEPFNPHRSMRFFKNIKSIVIDRDPRDIYLAAWDYTNRDGSKGWKSTLGKDVKDFVRRFRIYRDNCSNNRNDDMLTLSFEDLVLHYEDTLKTVYKFLDIDESVHNKKKCFFDPEVSKVGVGRWKETSREEEIDYIYKNLRDYCK